MSSKFEVVNITFKRCGEFCGGSIFAWRMVGNKANDQWRAYKNLKMLQTDIIPVAYIGPRQEADFAIFKPIILHSDWFYSFAVLRISN